MFFHCVSTCRTICPQWSGVRVQFKRFRIKLLRNFIILYLESVISLFFQFNCFLLIFNNIRCLLWVRICVNKRIQRSVNTGKNRGHGYPPISGHIVRLELLESWLEAKNRNPILVIMELIIARKWFWLIDFRRFSNSTTGKNFIGVTATILFRPFIPTGWL